MEENIQDIPLKDERYSFLKSRNFKFFGISFFVLVFFILIYFFLFSAPSNFIPGTILQVEPGMSLHSISLKLKKENIIRSSSMFEIFAIAFGGEKRIKFSDYLFEEKMPVYKAALLIVKGERYTTRVAVTIPEGLNINEIVEVYSKKLKYFNKNNFLLKAKEGYLFPDTYYFLSTDTEIKAIESMSKNYEKKIAPLREAISLSGKTENEIIIMASILEKEASGDADRELISGILWKRLSIGMPLQVDAEPNTYKVKGLPREPIGNPGLEAINAALNPKKSSYLYYIHDKEGNTHYAKSFSEHKLNIAKFLK